MDVMKGSVLPDLLQSSSITSDSCSSTTTAKEQRSPPAVSQVGSQNSEALQFQTTSLSISFPFLTSHTISAINTTIKSHGHSVHGTMATGSSSVFLTLEAHPATMTGLLQLLNLVLAQCTFSTASLSVLSTSRSPTRHFSTFTFSPHSHSAPLGTTTSPKVFKSVSPATKYRKLKVLTDSTSVYLVRDQETNTHMVMKEPHTSSQELQNEHDAVKQVHDRPRPCPGVVATPRMYKHVDNFGLPRFSLVYPKYSMDLFDFMDLYAKRHRMLIPEQVARAWIAQMLLSISVCVAQGVVHRDLKLENVLLDEYGNCVISDFGLAYLADADVTDNVNIVGTPMYIPPEAIKERRVYKSKHDMWSLGVLAWEIVSNGNPWRLDGDLPAKKLFEVTTETTKGGFEKETYMSDEMYEFIAGCVCPVEERLTPKEAMLLPLFEGIRFESEALFASGRARGDLKDVAGLLDACS